MSVEKTPNYLVSQNCLQRTRLAKWQHLESRNMLLWNVLSCRETWLVFTWDTIQITSIRHVWECVFRQHIFLIPLFFILFERNWLPRHVLYIIPRQHFTVQCRMWMVLQMMSSIGVWITTEINESCNLLVPCTLVAAHSDKTI